MPDATELALITASLPAALTFVFQRVERLLSSRGVEPEADIAVPDALTGTLQLPLQPDHALLDQRRHELEMLRDALADYSHGDVPVPASPALLRNWARLRDALEDIYSQRLTFAGEDRPASGPFVHQKADVLTGEATGMDADDITGNARVVQDVGRVERDAKMTGMKARRIGP
ncbi:hypothetical protein GTW44_16680 [Streptomyces sp. SID8360]|uniref:hypothetical protein n=1 Tax=unclassified Streptomyces TaxID=2593676 RepID=UPI0001C1C6D7|nr:MULTISPECIES: hypothetical protein [unclassified Streptomyces]AEN08003.1 hypothetical protein SACTE_0037 [Streptomyces sp. SirexAA-E]RAJ39915.1 hypothetical protein K352_06396 [Streptomyces sp. DpondAA-A50]SCD30033.1 hypothetical protein GA0115235_100912 [Streptomyces sp. DpondAA-F4a]SCM06189.1 hypothetical protein SAMN04883147_107012 [Streptomyces sp. DpondAA-F4]MYR67633.1 hypothetical protein [Streptomyces sp. SID4939]